MAAITIYSLKKKRHRCVISELSEFTAWGWYWSLSCWPLLPHLHFTDTFHDAILGSTMCWVPSSFLSALIPLNHPSFLHKPTIQSLIYDLHRLFMSYSRNTVFSWKIIQNGWAGRLMNPALLYIIIPHNSLVDREAFFGLFINTRLLWLNVYLYVSRIFTSILSPCLHVEKLAGSPNRSHSRRVVRFYRRPAH